MKKLIASILLILAVITSSGCTISSSQKAMIDVVSSAITADYIYSESNIINSVGNISLSDTDTSTIISSLTVVDEERGLLKIYKDNPEKILVNIASIDYSYTRIKNAYISIKDVVERNKELYTPEELSTFLEFDEAVVVLDSQYENLKTAIADNETFNVVLDVANIVVKLGGIAL